MRGRRVAGSGSIPAKVEAADVVAVAVVMTVAVCGFRAGHCRGRRASQWTGGWGGWACGMRCTVRQVRVQRQEQENTEDCRTIYHNLWITLAGKEGNVESNEDASPGWPCFPRVRSTDFVATTISVQRFFCLRRLPERSVPGGVASCGDDAALGAILAVRWAAVAGGGCS